MKKLLLTLVLSLTFSVGFSASLYLINDAIFELTAEIQSADGTFLDSVLLKPNEKFRWSTDRVGSRSRMPQAVSSLTPFIVIWKCPQKGNYSVCSSVSTGSTVISSVCIGSYRCRTREERAEDKENLKCPPCPPCK